MSQIVILSGPSGAGKSSVSEALCERYDRTVHIETDWFFEAIRMGRINPMHPGSGDQNQMIARAVARAATTYAEQQFGVFIDGVIGPHLLPIYLEELRPASVLIQFVLLLPSLEKTLTRVAPRDSTLRLQEPLHRDLHRQFVTYGTFAGWTLDNSEMTAEQAADAVMDACGRGDCLVSLPS
jgi:2-phosphoglycerate kinase